MFDLVIREAWEDTPLQEASEWVLEKQVEHHSHEENCKDVTDGELVDRDGSQEETFRLLGVHQLDHQRSDQASHKAQLAGCDAEGSRQHRTKHREVTCEDQKDHRHRGEHPPHVHRRVVDSVEWHRPLVRLFYGRMTNQ